MRTLLSLALLVLMSCNWPRVCVEGGCALLEISPIDPMLVEDSKLQLVATARGDEDEGPQDVTATVTWTSSERTVALVEGGLVSAVHEGTSVVTATLAGQSASIAVRVSASPLRIDPPSMTVGKGATIAFKALWGYGEVNRASVIWSSLDESVVTIDGSSGIATVQQKLGTAAIRAIDTRTRAEARSTVTVTELPLLSLTVTPQTTTVAKGATQQLTVTGTYQGGGTSDLTAAAAWQSSMAASAAVSNRPDTKGLVTGAGTGMATITASTGGQSGAAQVKVIDAALVSLAITPRSASVVKGGTRQFTVTGTYGDQSTMVISATWQSSDSTVAPITANGLARGLALPSMPTPVTLTASAGGKRATATLTVDCPAGQVMVMGGSYQMGDPDATGLDVSQSGPRVPTTVTTFCLDTTEVTVSAYGACVKAGKCTAPVVTGVNCNWNNSYKGQHPINCVDWIQATAYCEWKALRLPTEPEWEFAAHGALAVAASTYPWGATPTPDKMITCGSGGTCPVGAYQRTQTLLGMQVSMNGIADLAGNVKEWTASPACDYPLQLMANGCKNNTYGRPGERTLRGGAWYNNKPSDYKYMRTRAREARRPDDADTERAPGHGFRCAC